MWRSTEVLIDLNENTNRTVALAQLLAYLKLFTSASIAIQDCQPCLHKQILHFRHCCSYKFPWKDFRMHYIQCLLSTNLFIIFLLLSPILRCKYYNIQNDNLLIVLYLWEYCSLTLRKDIDRKCWGTGCFWEYLDINRGKQQENVAKL